MTHLARFFFLLLAVTPSLSVPALSDDQQKAKKETNKITAMATDATGRAIVNLSMSDMLGVKRLELVMERRATV